MFSGNVQIIVYRSLISSLVFLFIRVCYSPNIIWNNLTKHKSVGPSFGTFVVLNYQNWMQTVIPLIEPLALRWRRHVTRISGMQRNVWNKYVVGQNTRRGGATGLKMDVERVGCEGVHSIQLGHYRAHEGIFWGWQWGSNFPAFCKISLPPFLETVVPMS